MLSVDYRVGSGELCDLFLPYGIKPNKTKLEFGDMAFDGNGPNGVSAVCIERKRIEDLIDSMQSKRLSGHQLPGMSDTYDYCYLFVEGIWRPGKDGLIEISNGSWRTKGTHSRAVNSYLSTLEMLAGVVYRRTSSPQETVACAVDLYRWWQKPWHSHKAHEAIYSGSGDRRLKLVKREVSLVEQFATQLPGVDSKAREVAKRFKNIHEMTAASVADWMGIDGIGKIGARRIVAALQGKQSA